MAVGDEDGAGAGQELDGGVGCAPMDQTEIAKIVISTLTGTFTGTAQPRVTLRAPRDRGAGSGAVSVKCRQYGLSVSRGQFVRTKELRSNPLQKEDAHQQVIERGALCQRRP